VEEVIEDDQEKRNRKYMRDTFTIFEEKNVENSAN
jgi:hypothetical protein